MNELGEQLSEQELEEIENNVIEDEVGALDHIILILSSFGVFGIGTIWYIFFY